MFDKPNKIFGLYQRFTVAANGGKMAWCYQIWHDTPMFQCSNTQMFQCPNAPIFQWCPNMNVIGRSGHKPSLRESGWLDAPRKLSTNPTAANLWVWIFWMPSSATQVFKPWMAVTVLQWLCVEYASTARPTEIWMVGLVPPRKEVVSTTTTKEGSSGGHNWWRPLVAGKVVVATTM